MASIAAALPVDKDWRNLEGKRVLGKGAFGIVCASINPETFSPRAVKFGLDRGRAQVEREYEILNGRLRGAPHIIQVKELYCTAEKVALAMQRVSGPNLYQLVRKHPEEITFEVFCKIAEQGCEALVALKKAGVVHSDIKPKNLFYQVEMERLTVLDFGLAFLPPKERWRGGGTTTYMAPEMVLKHFPSYGIDMWALGATLFFAYTGRSLFLGPDGGKCLDKKSLFWAFDQQLGEPFVEYVQHVTLEWSRLPEEQKNRRMESARKLIDLPCKESDSCPPQMPWRQRIYETAEAKMEPHAASEMVRFLDRIFVSDKIRITPEEGLKSILLEEDKDSSDGESILV